MIRINQELLNFFSRLSESSASGLVKEIRYFSKDKIVTQGKYVSSIYIIKSGVVKCYVNEDNGRDFIQEFFSTGEILGELEVFNDIISFCNAEAITEVTGYQIDVKDFYTLLENHPELNILLLKALANKVRDTAIRASQQQSYPIAYNLKKLMKFSSDEAMAFSKQDIADYLGITLRSLNRALHEIS
ncbi:CRP-like cAMP-binding protein [Aquimarina sp. MAR_2010_214]|uniref:Crp/Fnr family transcriptional regulator n=1 Tax=Aquimarina sp. MAR_2010_214 TaxID=1250026 RepID=UPI000C6FFC6B|nr:Crp/Fnr family transcriptional regulator [Aquimarina sp. MAR_2010_214]PKV51444.1 CRP-like cAMP-binding protein [Aquimarina sp. MAR_2010_214]